MVNLNRYIDKFIIYKQSYCSVRTVAFYEDSLYKFFDWAIQIFLYDIEQLNKDVLQNYVAYLTTNSIKKVSVHTYYRAVKAFCKWLYNCEYIEKDITRFVSLPKKENELVEPLTREEAALCDKYFVQHNQIRNYCIFHLMLDCGLRLQEVIHLTVDDITYNNHLKIRNTKGNKSRIVLIPDFLQQNIKNYIGDEVAHQQRVNIFLDRYNRKPITNDTVKQIFVDIRTYTNIKRLHPHLLRHTFATSYMYYVKNIEMLRLLMGHEDYNTTKIYLHLAAQEQLLQSDIYKIDDIYFN